MSSSTSTACSSRRRATDPNSAALNTSACGSAARLPLRGRSAAMKVPGEAAIGMGLVEHQPVARIAGARKIPGAALVKLEPVLVQRECEERFSIDGGVRMAHTELVGIANLRQSLKDSSARIVGAPSLGVDVDRITLRARAALAVPTFPPAVVDVRDPCVCLDSGGQGHERDQHRLKPSDTATTAAALPEPRPRRTRRYARRPRAEGPRPG